MRLLTLLGIVALGVLSRTVHSSYALFDKYLGDALYAAMVYTILRIAGVRHAWIAASLIMLAIELFQLTGIPASLAASDQSLIHYCGVLLGTQFSLLDLLAYAIGIASIHALNRFISRSRSSPQSPEPPSSRSECTRA